MMRKRWQVMVAMASVLVLAGVAVGGDGEVADGRPVVLVIGSRNVMPEGTSPGWPRLVASDRADWRVVVSADAGRVLGDIASDVDGVLADVEAASAVVLVMGNNEARTERFAEADAAALRKQMDEVLGKLKSHEKLKGAKLALATPVPVVDARLDQWQKKVYGDTGGESRCAAIAEMVREAAKANEVALIDLYAWVYEDKGEEEDPGAMVGGTGFLLQGWSHAKVAAWMGRQIAMLGVRPRDAAAYAKWKQLRQAQDELDRLLARTSEGLVRHGEALEEAKQPPAVRVAGQKKPVVFKGTHLRVPVEAVQGEESLELLFKPVDEGLSALQVEISPVWLYVRTDGGDMAVTMPSWGYVMVDEAAPTKVVDSQRFFMNIGRLRYLPVVSGKPGARRWALLRIPLDELKGRKIAYASVSWSKASYVNEGTWNDFKPVAPLGDGTVHLIEGRDADFDLRRATWRTRDGERPWTGGAVNEDAREAVLERFLQRNPMKPVRKEADQMLRKLGQHHVEGFPMEN